MAFELRRLRLCDLNLFYSIASDHFVRRFLMEGLEISLAECREIILTSDTLYQRLNLGLSLVFDHGELIGYAGFVESLPASSDLEILFALTAPQSGLGKATIICRTLIGRARQNSFRGDLVAVVHPDNLASVRVLEKNGFTCVGHAAGELAHLLAYRIKL